MKINIFLVLVTISQILAVSTYSQNKRISLYAKNTAIKDVLGKIEKTSEFSFMYDATKVDVEQKIDISTENQLITGVLDAMLKNKGISYLINNKQIALKSIEFTIQQPK